jgi:2-polyprenyl-3-methyl-5-hydroxy-6-metoxy-1,4-benzoquinol methylase
MQTHGWNIAGVEPAAAARAKASNLTQHDIAPSINTITEKYNVITLWHVLEHVHDLREKLAAIVSHLQIDGKLFIAVPNHESPDAEKYKEYWAAYDVPRHLWHFTKKDIKQLLESLGLKIVAIEPMKMDAFYVSMLSEQYRSPNKNKIVRTISATLSGMASNLKAAKTTNHSSLIYIAQR